MDGVVSRAVIIKISVKYPHLYSSTSNFAFEPLLKLKKCMSTIKYEDYVEKFPKLIDNRVQTIRDVLTKMTGG